MKKIPLTAIPNQHFTFRVGSKAFELTLKESRGVMLFSLAKEGVTLVHSVRCCAFEALLPYAYLEKEVGNLHFATAGEAYPYYTRFSSSDRLFYLSPDELAELRQA